MEFKPDFDEMAPRMEAWWRGVLLDRACISVGAPNGRRARELAPPATLFARWTDFDYLLDAFEAQMESIYYGGEAIPVFRPSLGPDVFSAFLGCPLHFADTTSWAEPIISTWEQAPSFEIDRESFAFKWHDEMYPRAAARARGRYWLGGLDCHSGGEAVRAMRGSRAACLDLYDHPEAVRAAMGKLEQTIIEFHEAVFGWIEASGQPGHTNSFLSVWSPGRSNVVQLDLLALISPAQFREFFYRELEVQCEYLDNALFHLDGPDALAHLPLLYDLLDCRRGGRSALRAIQWVPGEGNGPMTKWIPLLKEMQSNGAGLVVHCGPKEVETIMRELSSRGLFIATGAASKEEAEALVSLVRKLTHE